jgi:hypothetical protein
MRRDQAVKILVNGNRNVVAEWRDRLPLGYLLNPGGGVSVATAIESGLPWALDNGAFGKTPEAKFWQWVEQIRAHPEGMGNLLFVVPPDVPFNAHGTLGLFWWNLTWLADADEALDLPLAIVGQDGMEDLEWDHFFRFADCFFIGGSTEWKLSQSAASLASEAKRRGLWVHMGRVNSVKRLEWALSIGCDSVDGTGLTRFSRSELPRVSRRLADGPVVLTAEEWTLLDCLTF